MRRRAASPKTSLPSLFKMLYNNRKMGVVSNWASFLEEDLTLPGCKQLLHLPLYDLDSMSTAGPGYSSCILFRPKKRKLALFIAGEENLVASLKNQPIVGKSIFAKRRKCKK
mmetsp:Transcript_29496/g.41124  ORF Transcript_29496/g.41124 Transcript_29496/m.41124 type:complete len:112 (-) Transcript_29496:167-502(-)